MSKPWSPWRKGNAKPVHEMSRRGFLMGLTAMGGAAAAAGHRPLRGVAGAAPTPPPGADYYVTNRTQLLAVLALGSATLSGKIVEFADGAAAQYGLTPIFFTTNGLDGGPALTPAVETVFRAQNRQQAQLPGVSLAGCQNIRLRQLSCIQIRANLGGTTAMIGAISVQKTTGVTIDDCEAGSDPFATTFDPTGYMNVSNVVGTFIDGEKVVTNIAGTGNSGYYQSDRPRSSATVFAITAADGSPVGGGSADWTTYWYKSSTPTARFITGQTSGATATIGDKFFIRDYLYGIGGGSSTSAPTTNLTMVDNYIHDVQSGVSGNGAGITMLRNLIIGYYDAPFSFANDCSQLNIKDNRCIDNWSANTDGQPVGTGGPHASLGNFSFVYYMVTDVNVEGNIFLSGLSRKNYDGHVGVVSGPKFNDQNSKSMTCFVDSGNHLHITALDANWLVKNGQRVLGGSVPALDTIITGQLSGTTGKTGVYTINNTMPDMASTTGVALQSRVGNCTVRSNLTDSNLNIGWDVTYLADAIVAYNTMITTRDTHNPDQDAGALLYWGDNDRTYIHSNISIGTAANNRFTDPLSFSGSINNYQMPLNQHSGPGSYEGCFNGVGGANPYGGMTLANALAMFSYKTAGPLDGAGIGHAAYYDFATGISSYPAFSPPVTNTPTGTVMPAVYFDGTNVGVYTPTSPAVAFDLVSTNLFTLMLTLRMRTADATDKYLFGGCALSVRRLPTNNIRFALTGGVGGTSVQIDSSCTIKQSDGMVVLLFSVDIANGKWRVQKGQIADGLANVVTWNGVARGNFAGLTANLPSTSGSPHASFDVAQYYITDQFVDTYDSAVLSRLVAQDNNPVDLGANGSLLTGTQPKGYAKGNSAAWWNGGGGIQLGSAVKRIIPSYAPPDV